MDFKQIGDSVLINGDCLEVLRQLNSESVDIVISDIPYGICYDEWDILHNNKNKALGGSSAAQIKAGNVFQKRGKPLNGWSNLDKNISSEYYDWCYKWTPTLFNILKSGSSVFLFAGRRMAHKCISAMEDSGFIFKDMIAWEKQQAPHRAQRVSVVYEKRRDEEHAKQWEGWRLGNLRPIFEPILWFMKPYKIGSTITDNLIINKLGAFNNEKWKTYNSISSNMIKIKSDKNDTGLHPTQKPVCLIESLIELVSLENQIILDMFMGTGTTGAACKNLNRKFIGIELDKGYFDIACKRIEEGK